MQDIKLTKTDGNYYDLTIANGDFESIDGLDTAIYLSMLVDKRADSSERPEPLMRRGWIGNEQNDDENYEIGSKLWLLDQARSNQDSLNRAIDYLTNCFQWMIDDNLIKDIDIGGTIIEDNIIINVQFTRFNNTIFNIQFELWENTTIA